jgi:alcohol dehydrogenase class IV
MDINMESLPHSNWNYPTHIKFGNGRVSELQVSCDDMNIHKPLIVTDNGLADFDFINNIKENVKGAQIFSAVKANPNDKNISDGVNMYKQGGHDGVVAIGGGSALDAGKAIGLMVGQDRSIWDFEDVGDNYLNVNVPAMAGVIAIPTTAGTGSEVGRASVIVDESTHTKKIIFHPNMLPAQVILDPELTIGLPANITSATGLDAFVHSLEAYLAPGYHPMADGIALQSMRLIKEYLPLAYQDGSNLVARGHMLCASTMGATAFQKGLGGVHALAHPLGAIFDKHHGLLNAILLPFVLQRNKSAIVKKIEVVCSVLGLPPGFDCFINWLMDFRAQLGIPNTLGDIGLSPERSDEIGQLASLDATSATNPVALTAQDYSDLFILAVKGF